MIALLGLGAGSGWGLYFWQRSDERRDKERAQAQEVMHTFLEPLQFTLEHGRHFHRLLTDNTELRSLELSPDYLQWFFSSLPPNDPRKRAWRGMVAGMIEENGKAIELIKANRGRVRRTDFGQACDSFAKHAYTLKYVWESSLGNQPVPDSLRGRNLLLAPAFPTGMDSLLTLELAEWRQIARE